MKTQKTKSKKAKTLNPLETPLTNETRTWAELDRALQQNTGGQHTLASRIVALGGVVR